MGWQSLGQGQVQEEGRGGEGFKHSPPSLSQAEGLLRRRLDQRKERKDTASLLCLSLLVLEALPTVWSEMSPLLRGTQAPGLVSPDCKPVSRTTVSLLGSRRVAIYGCRAPCWPPNFLLMPASGWFSVAIPTPHRGY